MRRDRERRAGPGPGGRPTGRLFDLPIPEDVRRELDSHLEMKVEELVALGWTPAAARSEAERLFGDARTIAAECRSIARRQRRSVRFVRFLESVAQDLRQGARVLVRHRSFSAVAVLTLGLGIGANVAVFALIDGLLLAPLPYTEPDRLVSLWELNEVGGQIPVAEPNYLDWRELSTSFSGMSAFRGPFASSVLSGGSAVRRSVSIVSGEFFEVMRSTAVIGRLPTAAEAGPGAARVAVVSHAFWQTVLEGTTDLGGAHLEVEGIVLDVAAVLPERFDFPTNTDVWMVGYPDAGGTRTSHNYQVIARLADDVRLESAQSEMRAIGGQLAAVHAGAIDAVSVAVVGLAEDLYGSYRSPLLLLLGAAGIVLLVACTNLASTMLARSVVRRREVAVRVSLGAGRRRLARQLLTENSLLALAGGIAGLVLAFGVLEIVSVLAPARILGLRDTSLSFPVLLFTLGISVAAVFLFGLVPALRSDDESAGTLLRGGDRGGTGQRGSVWGVLVAAEVGMALLLLVFTGLLVRSFREIVRVDPGFDGDGVVIVDLYVPRTGFPDDVALTALHASLIEALERSPDVSAAGIISRLPVLDGPDGGVDIEGDDVMAYAEYRVADGGYFEAMRIPVVRGRTFQSTDRRGSPEVALVDEAFARRYLDGADPVGRRIRNLRNDSWLYGRNNWITIVGVVGAVRQSGLLRNPDPTVYVAASQRPNRARDAVLTVRADGRDAGAAAVTVRNTLARLAPSVPFEIGTVNARIGSQLADRRFAMLVIGGFGLIALLLAAIGIHGVVAYSVERRNREMGVRIALGAAPDGVARRVVMEAMRPVLAGIGAGLLGALALRRVIEAALVAVEPTDPLTLAASIAVLTVIALVACALPARAVAHMDPIEALRAE